MSRQDKATTERFTKILRELVKKPENKVCADCKKNDPRWASWNIGVFLCIRCSGVHRGMGTHISKVKSVDLDTWTPEQMESIQKWGNYLANLYWEAHLKPGHTPPDHKIESFIRSKYESKKWARDGPIPMDPSVLANGREVASHQQPQTETTTSVASRRTHTTNQSLSGRSSITRQPQAHQLLSANYTTAQRPHNSTTTGSLPPPVAAAAQPPPQPQPKAPENDIFSLDFHAPPASSSSAATATDGPKKDVKQDILSLFSSPTPVSTPAFSQFGGVGTSPWGTAQPQQPTSLIGTNGVGAWGISSGWSGAPAPAQVNPWGPVNPPTVSHQPGQASLLNTTDVWSAPAPAAASGPSQDLIGSSFGSSFGGGHSTQKKDDAFGDIWGGFK